MLDSVVFPSVAAFLGGLVTWVFSRRISKAQAISQELDNYQKNAEYYQKMVDDLAGRYQKVLEDLRLASETIKEKDRQIDELMESINHLTEELKKYKQLNGKS